MEQCPNCREWYTYIGAAGVCRNCQMAVDQFALNQRIAADLSEINQRERQREHRECMAQQEQRRAKQRARAEDQFHLQQQALRELAKEHARQNRGGSAKDYWQLMCALHGVLRTYDANGYYVWPHWESSNESLTILQNAFNQYCLLKSETVLAVLDTTSLVDRMIGGAGYHGLIFGTEGVYYNPIGPGANTDTNFVLYRDISRFKFTYSGLNSLIAIHLGNSSQSVPYRSFDLKSSAMSKAHVVGLLTDIQQLFVH